MSTRGLTNQAFTTVSSILTISQGSFNFEMYFLINCQCVFFNQYQVFILKSESLCNKEHFLLLGTLLSSFAMEV